jgi:hypothetical protein
LYTLIAYLCYVTFHYCQDTLSCCGSGAEKWCGFDSGLRSELFPLALIV